MAPVAALIVAKVCRVTATTEWRRWSFGHLQSDHEIAADGAEIQEQLLTIAIHGFEGGALRRSQSS